MDVTEGLATSIEVGRHEPRGEERARQADTGGVAWAPAASPQTSETSHTTHISKAVFIAIDSCICR